jgi:hypothetical protein
MIVCTSAVSNTRPAIGTCAARDLFRKLEKCSLIIILAYFWAIFLISMSIALQIKPFLIDLSYYATSLDFGPFDAARRVIFTIICGPQGNFPSQCGPCEALSLRPLVYMLFKTL